jgi:hypothetical protein
VVGSRQCRSTEPRPARSRPQRPGAYRVRPPTAVALRRSRGVPCVARAPGRDHSATEPPCNLGQRRRCLGGCRPRPRCTRDGAAGAGRAHDQAHLRVDPSTR